MTDLLSWLSPARGPISSLPCLFLLAASLGCADGDRRGDSTDGGIDSGPADVDTGPGVDVGPPDIPTDAGTDSTLPMLDAGPGDADVDAPTDTGPAVDAGPLSFRTCFERQFVNPRPADFGPDYDQFNPVMGSHCMGTNHQDIQGVERIVFVGDSVTVGSPPTMTMDYYRVRLATELALHFGLDRAAGLAGGFAFEGWSTVDVFEGTSINRVAGDFAHCAKWGARTDDLIRDNDQIVDCIPESERNKTTLVVMTVGGNDVFNLTEDASDGVSEEMLRTEAEEFVELMENAVLWLKEPGRFPNGVYVVFANMYEYTDATRELDACPGAGLAGFTGVGRDVLEELIVWANEQFLRIAVETGTDMIFMLEGFCGHGYRRDLATGQCYRGPGQTLYFDETCIHPSPAGHQAISDMFLATIQE